MDIKLLGICFGHQAVRLVQGIAYTARCSIPRRLNHSRPALPSNRYWKSPCRFGFSARSAEEAEEFNAKTCAPEKEIHHNRPDPAKRELHKPDLPCMCADPMQIRFREGLTRLIHFAWTQIWFKSSSNRSRANTFACESVRE